MSRTDIEFTVAFVPDQRLSAFPVKVGHRVLSAELAEVALDLGSAKGLLVGSGRTRDPFEHHLLSYYLALLHSLLSLGVHGTHELHRGMLLALAHAAVMDPPPWPLLPY